MYFLSTIAPLVAHKVKLLYTCIMYNHRHLCVYCIFSIGPNDDFQMGFN